MNKYGSYLILGGLLAATPSITLWANDMTPTETESKAHAHKGERMKKELGLSNNQAVKLKAIHEAERDALKPFMEKERALRQKRDEQLKSKASESEIKATLEEMKANRKAMTEQRQTFRKQREDLLTPTQEAKMDQMHQERREHRMKGRMGEPGER